MNSRIVVVVVIGLALAAGLFLLRQQLVRAQVQQLLAEQAAETAQRVNEKAKPADFKPDVPRPTFQGAKPPRWEYKVFTLPDRDEEANEWLAKMADDGWEYTSVVVAAVPPRSVATQNSVQSFPATPPRLLFKRMKK